MKPTVAVLLGDPTGIGPELVAKLLAGPEPRERANVLVVGDRRLFEMGQQVAKLRVPYRAVSRLEEARFDAGDVQLLDVPGVPPEEVTVGRLSAQAGKSVLETMTAALRLAREGKLNAIVFAPLNKQAMRMGGSPFPDELHFMAHELGVQDLVRELNVLDDLWLSRVTSHVALGTVSSLITKQRVFEGIQLIHRTLRRAGTEQPRIAVAAFNPHGGEGGLFGREEIDEIAPGVEMARAAGMTAEGPFPADTIFLRARKGEYHAIVSMYHDQGQIAMKLMGFDRGVTVQGGLPIPVATPAHGTAFDIAGKGIANPGATQQAFRLACRMAAPPAGG
jgi:4-hydroxythreonine-4-phosphate dehydrogenase